MKSGTQLWVVRERPSGTLVAILPSEEQANKLVARLVGRSPGALRHVALPVTYVDLDELTEAALAGLSAPPLRRGMKLINEEGE